jgi:hypothetical protein
MRDYRDAKAMARSLRDALRAKALPTTHSESLELIAKAFGYDNWNILSAKIDAAQSISRSATSLINRTPHHDILYCSFRGKNQHEVQKLIAGPSVFICDECVDLCIEFVDEHLVRFIEGDESSARAMSTERLQHYVDHAAKGAQRCRLALQRIETMLAYKETSTTIDDGTLLSTGFDQFKNRHLTNCVRGRRERRIN